MSQTESPEATVWVADFYRHKGDEKEVTGKETSIKVREIVMRKRAFPNLTEKHLIELDGDRWDIEVITEWGRDKYWLIKLKKVE